MKLFKLLFTASLFLFLTACSDDDSAPSGEGVVGKWDVTAINYSGTSTTESGGQTFTSDFVGTGFDMNLQIEFKENPMEYTTSGDYSIDLETTFMGQTSNSTATNQGFIGAGAWAQVGDDLVITTDMGDEQTATIVSLDGNVMVLGWASTMVQMQNGATSTLMIDGTYTFERQ